MTRNALVKKALPIFAQSLPGTYKVFQLHPRDYLNFMPASEAVISDLQDAIHETAHVTGPINGFLILPNGTLLENPNSDPTHFPNPRVIREMVPKSTYSLYIDSMIKEGQFKGDMTDTPPSSNYSFFGLLDEFNSYLHDANIALVLYPKLGKKWSAENYWSKSEGIFAFMTYVKVYLNEAQKRHPKTWRTLNQRKYARTIKALWPLAEKTALATCKKTRSKVYVFPKFKKLMKVLCDESTDHGINGLLGRSHHSCARACL